MPKDNWEMTMTPIDSTTIEPVNQDDPELRVAALNSLGLAAGMTTSVLRSVLLKRLADDEFVPDDSTTTAMLLLEKANVSNAQLADVFESMALTKLQVLRANFPTWSPAERRQHWDDLQRYVSHVPYLARQLTALRPGLEWVPPDLASVSPVVYQIVEQTIILFSLSPMQRIAARAEYFSKSPLGRTTHFANLVRRWFA